MEVLGTLAGALTLLTYLPQAFKTIRTRRTADLSLPTYILLVLSALLWTLYGLGRQLPSVWATNAVVSLLGAIILGLKLRQIQPPRPPQL